MGQQNSISSAHKSSTKQQNSTDHIKKKVGQKIRIKNQQRGSNQFIPPLLIKLKGINQFTNKEQATISTNNTSKAAYIVKNNELNQNFEHYKKAYKILMKSPKNSYRDPEFLANQTSLSFYQNRFEITCRFDQIQYARPEEFLQKSEYTLFPKNNQLINPDNLKLGCLKNPYFISALSILAKHDQNLIRSIFLDDEIKEEGIYGIILCSNGNFQQTVIDDLLPIINNQPAFAKTQNSELWISYLEKAYAKNFGTYQHIQQGLCGHLLHDLTGAPYEYKMRSLQDINEMQPSEIFSYIKQNLEKNYIVAVSREKNLRNKDVYDEEEEFTKMIEDKQKLKEELIDPQFSYLILDCQVVPDVEREDNDLNDYILKVYNPFDDNQQTFGKWRGDWSENSEKWNQQNEFLHLKQDYKQKGISWISCWDFQQLFNQICVVKVNPENKYSSLCISNSKKDPLSEFQSTEVILVNIPNEEKNGFITISQKDKNFFRDLKKNQSYEYSLIRFCVVKLDNQNKVEEFIGAVVDNERDVSLEIKDVKPGNYAILIEIDWNQDLIRDFTISYYGESGAQIVRAMNNLAEDYQKLLQDVIEIHQKIEDPQRHVKLRKNIYRVSGSFGGYVYFYYRNESDDLVLRENVELQQRQFLEICPPEIESSQFSLIIPPQSTRIVTYRAQAEGYGMHSYKNFCKNIVLQSFDQKNEDDRRDFLIYHALIYPSKIKQRSMNGHFMNVFIHYYNYFGGVCILYLNNTQQKTYCEDLKLELNNLHCSLANETGTINIKIPPCELFLLDLKQIDLEDEVSYQMTPTFYLK
ncbi:hypothetical protein PPERSA_11165 [Pseudocohnilembus persalinus]|uniref:Calpain catalytic domain-containing protein n=1 Tax=Pseudocohnilembus persalinus TaxID=266149 RepID=A0A0V0R003_PSEPJ|nr:hypothetical protein PPERSA_11165 [Pseudocohnilembus persalinus]|eukprot:KRX07616.1 hypothetical protein PPERSA_11165 [Pseudocohnilembus persalinus]